MANNLEKKYLQTLIAECDEEYRRAQLECETPEDGYYASHGDDFELYCSNVWDEYNNFVESCIFRADARGVCRDGLIAIAKCRATDEDAADYIDGYLADCE